MPDGKLEISVILTAVDRMTSMVNKVTAGASKGLAGFSQKANAVSESAARLGRNAAIGAVALAAPLIYATKQAIAFEDKMADVAKVAGFKVGGSQFIRASSEAIDLSKRLAMAADQSAALMANLAAGGVETAKLHEIGLLAGQMGVAFNMSGDAAGEAFIKMKNGMGASYQQTKLVADAINKLSDATASEANEIVEFMAAGGAGVSNLLKINGKDIAAFGATMISFGKSGAEAATIMEKVQNGILLKKGYSDIFKKAGGGTEGILAVLEKGAGSSNPLEFFKSFGLLAPQIAQLAGTMNKTGGLRDALKLVAKEGSYSGSVLKEFGSRSATTKFKLDQAKASFQAAAIGAGTAFLPVLTKLLNTVTPMIERLSKWIQKNPELTATIMKVVAAAAATLAVISGVSFAVSGVAKVISAASTVFSFASKAVTFFSSAFQFLNLIIMSNPIVALITLIVAAVVGLAYAIYKYWDQIKAFFIRLWTGIKAIFWKVVAWVKEWGILFIGPIGFVIKYWDKIVDFFKAIPSKMYESGKNIILGLWNGIKSMAKKVIEEVSNLASTIWNKFKSVLGERSPSRVFMLSGRNIALGAAMGIAAAAPMAVNATANMATKIIKAPSGVRTASSPRAGGMGGGANYHFSPTINAQGAGAGVEQDIKAMLDKYGRDFYRKMKEMERKEKRTDFK